MVPLMKGKNHAKNFCIYTGADGQSHIAAEPLALQPFVDTEGAHGEGTPLQQATGITFRLSPPGYVLHWHCAPRRQYTITLSGAAEVEVGDGNRGGGLCLGGCAARRRPDRAGPHYPRCRDVYASMLSCL